MMRIANASSIIHITGWYLEHEHIHVGISYDILSDSTDLFSGVHAGFHFHPHTRLAYLCTLHIS